MGTKRIINLNATTDFEDDDNIVVDSTTAGTRKMSQSVLKSKMRDFTLGDIHNLPTTIAAFRTGDVIPVDGPSGTAKIGKDDLLKETEKFSNGFINPLLGTTTADAKVSRTEVTGRALKIVDDGDAPVNVSAPGSSIMVFACTKGDVVRVSGKNTTSVSNIASVQTFSADSFTNTTTTTTMSTTLGDYDVEFVVGDERFVAITFDTGTTPLCKVVKTEIDVLDGRADDVDAVLKVSYEDAFEARTIQGYALRISDGIPVTSPAANSSIRVYSFKKGDVVLVDGINNNTSVSGGLSIITMSANSFISSTTATEISSKKASYRKTIVIGDETFVAITFDNGTTPLCKVVKNIFESVFGDLAINDELFGITKKNASIHRQPIADKTMTATLTVQNSTDTSVMVFECKKGDVVMVAGKNTSAVAGSVSVKLMSEDSFVTAEYENIVSQLGDYKSVLTINDKRFVAITYNSDTTPSCVVYKSETNEIFKIDGVELYDASVSRQPLADKALASVPTGSYPLAVNVEGSSIMVFSCHKGDYIEVSGVNNGVSTYTLASVQTFSADSFTSTTTTTTISLQKGAYKERFVVGDESFVAITFDSDTTPYCKIISTPAKEYTKLQLINYSKNGVAVVKTDALSDGESFSLNDFPYCSKKGDVYNFRCGISGDFAGVKICRGYGTYRSAIFQITATAVNLLWRENSGAEGDVIESHSHGLSIGTLLYVNIRVDDDAKAHFRMVSSSGYFDCVFENYKSDANGLLQVLSQSDLTDCVLSATNEDFKKDVWLFGDSYFGVNESRWCGHLKEAGYWDLYLNALAGRSSAAAYSDLSKAMKLGCPKYMMWGILGNNYTSPSVFYEYFDMVVKLCKENNVTPIFITMANVPDRDGLYEPMNEYVRVSGERYVDWAFATNPDGGEVGSTWYDGMLSSDGVHPTPLGASVLCFKVFEDFPEITECFSASGTAGQDGGGDL